MIVLLQPVISEKSMGLTKQSYFTFLVDRRARKPEIKAAVKEQFNVDVLNVKTMNIKSQTKLQRTRRGYFTVSAQKKAVVQLKAGQMISLFEIEAEGPGGAPKEEVTVTTAEGEPMTEVKEKKSLLKGTKVKVEKVKKEKK